MKNSHNSYLIKGDPVKKSIDAGCDIIEADIIDEKLHLSHSWRPFNCMYHGRLEDRYLKNFPEDKLLYIEFKTSKRSVMKPLYESLKRNGFEKIIIGATYNPFIDRVGLFKDFYTEYKDKLTLLFIDGFDVDNVDLYDDSIFNF